MTLGGVAVLALLLLTGAIGWVEWATGAVVMTAGALAFYVGSAPTGRKIRNAEVLEASSPLPVKSDDPTIASFIEALPLPALLVSPERQLASVNPHARRLFRLDKAAQSLPVALLRQPDLLAAAERVAEDGANERVEFTQHGDAEVWMAHVRSGPDTGSVLIVFEDLTAVRRAEKARADFLANASHELRTPLTAIAGFIETMRGPAKDDKASWDGFLEIMGQQTERMKRLVADLLSLSRIEFSEHRPPSTQIEIVDLARSTSSALTPIAKDAGISLHFDAPHHQIKAIAGRRRNCPSDPKLGEQRDQICTARR